MTSGGTIKIGACAQTPTKYIINLSEGLNATYPNLQYYTGLRVMGRIESDYSVYSQAERLGKNMAESL